MITASFFGAGHKKPAGSGRSVCPSPFLRAYIGDDINDIECIQYCGLSACPQDAVDQVKQIADYVCKCDGGRGAVREFIDVMLFNQKTKYQL